MSVILEFAIDAEEFRLGTVLGGVPGMTYELERIVPTGETAMPFVWATGTDHEQFTSRVRASSHVETLHDLDRVGTKGLYRIEWIDSPTELVPGIATAGGSILEGRGNSNWLFRVRFSSHDELSAFHTFTLEEGIPIEIERTYPLSDQQENDGPYGLTEEQERALQFAVEEGYFATPGEVSLEELADELDITRQALSNRIRRANEKVLQTVFHPGRP